MAPENMSPFPGQKKIEEEALGIDEKVDTFYTDPRTKKSHSADGVAHEIIKDQEDAPINLARLSVEEKRWYKNIMASGIRFSNNGFVEISRWDNSSQKTEGKKRLWQKTDGLNSAIRMQDKILGRYRSDEKSKSEFSCLESIQEVIESANDLMLEWKEAKPEEKEALQHQLAEVVLQLERCRNEFKIEVKDQSEAVIKMKDSLDRDNPSALAARTVAASNSLAKRMDEMRSIMPVMAMRKEILVLEKRRTGRALKRAEGELTGILHHRLFSDNSQKTPESRINDNEVGILDRKIGRALYFLGMVHTLPYSQQAEQARFCLMNKTKKFFRSKKELLDNAGPAKETLLEAIKILGSDVEHFG